MAATTPLVARGVHKRYGEVHALAGLDLEIGQGVIHGLLGPNGAGKTTAVRIFATLSTLDEGHVLVDGHDVGTRGSVVRTRIGYVGQQAALDERLDASQNLILFGRLSGLVSKAAQRRASELLEQFGLADVGSRAVSTFSGGMRRRLDIAASLILTPAVLFLDEATAGLDPQGRIEVWEAVRSVASSGTAVLLTTQYLEEADQLADLITVLQGGLTVAHGTPLELKDAMGGSRVVTVLPDKSSLAAAAESLGAEASVDADRCEITVPAPAGTADLVRVVRALDDARITPTDVQLRRPTLDEVFLDITSAHGAATSLEEK